jgi:uncharacterized membrane protein
MKFTKMKKTIFSTVIFASSAWLSLALGSQALSAEDTKIRLCNNNNQKVFLAFAYENSSNAPLLSRGWWVMGGNQCIELSLPLGSDKLLVHAASESGVLQWTGDQKLCVDTVNKFDFNDAASRPCLSNGLEIRGFKEVSITALSAASPGGIPKIDFDQRDAITLGSIVRVCNDSPDDTYLAFGQRNPGSTPKAVDGWFKISANSCIETLRDEDSTELLVFAQSNKGHKRWSGDAPLCTDNYDGFRFLEAEQMDCTGNNQRMQLFRRVPMTAASSDFEYHLRAEEALLARSNVDLCNTSDENVYVAIAWENPEFPGQVVTQGWISIEQGQCFEDLAVNSSSIMLRVEGEDGVALLEGSFEACIDIEEGFEFGKSTQMVCSGGTLNKRGFATQTLSAGDVRLNIP